MLNNSLLLSWICNQPWAVDASFARTAIDFLQARAGYGDMPSANHAFAADTTMKQPANARGVGIIPVHGTISHRISEVEGASVQSGVSSERLGQWVDAAVNDDSIGTIVLDIASGGGQVFGTAELANKIYTASKNKKIIAVANAYAASAAYWIGAAASEFYVTPSGMVGSVGVLLPHIDVSKKAENDGVKVTFIHAGEKKVQGNEFEPLSDSAKADMQARVDIIYDNFVNSLAIYRNTSSDNVRENFGKGDMVMPNDAVKAGMIDGIATLEDIVGGALAASGYNNKKNKQRQRAVALKRLQHIE